MSKVVFPHEFPASKLKGKLIKKNRIKRKKN